MPIRARAPGTDDPLGFALLAAEEHAKAAAKPFDEKEFWKVLEARGVRFERDGQPLAAGPESDERGTFLGRVALDLLYARRTLRRDMNMRGDYVYSR